MIEEKARTFAILTHIDGCHKCFCHLGICFLLQVVIKAVSVRITFPNLNYKRFIICLHPLPWKKTMTSFIDDLKLLGKKNHKLNYFSYKSLPLDSLFSRTMMSSFCCLEIKQIFNRKLKNRSVSFLKKV